MKHLKKALALLMAVAVMLTLIGGGFHNKVIARAAADLPTVYVIGQGWALTNSAGENVVDFSMPEGFLEAAVKDCLPSFLKAVLFSTDKNVNEYAEKLASHMAQLYAKAKFNENGEPMDDSGAPFDPAAPATPNGYDFYIFQYDWRRDPRETAAQLEVFIDNVRSARGVDQVNLLGRCEGCCPVMAYLSLYGAGKINRLFFLNSAFRGIVGADAPFSGNIYLEAEPARDWLDEMINGQLPDVPINSMDIVAQPYWLVLKALVRAVYESYGLELAAQAVNSIYNRMFRPALRETLLTGYATWPGIWAMVFEENVETAISFVFEGKEAQYAGLIEKIRGYDREVRAGADDLLKELNAQGVDIGVLAKYGYATDPIEKGAGQLSDEKAYLKHSSFGATTADFGETLSDAYIADAKAKGNGRYVSPDRMVDASTCLFPDSTWMVGNMKHQDFNGFLDAFAYRYFTSEAALAVDSDPSLPQYLIVIDGSVVPMTEENQSLSLSRPEQRGFWPALKEFYIQLFRYLKVFFASLPERLKTAAAQS